MRCARALGIRRPGIAVNCTGGGLEGGVFVRGDRRACVGGPSSGETMGSAARVIGGTAPGVLLRVCCRCVRVVVRRLRFAVGFRACMMGGLFVTL